MARARSGTAAGTTPRGLAATVLEHPFNCDCGSRKLQLGLTRGAPQRYKDARKDLRRSTCPHLLLPACC